MYLEETTSYRTYSLLNHLCTLMLIGTSLILLIFRLYFRKFNLVEMQLNLGYFALNFFYLLTPLTNIIITLFAAFGLHAKIKTYMNLYVFLVTFNISIMFTSLLFLFLFYNDAFNGAYSSQTSTSMSVALLIRSSFECQPAGSITCDDIIQHTKDRVYFVYLFLTFLSLIISFINLIVIKSASKGEIEKGIPRKPDIKECDRIGFQSESLRRRRFQDVGNNLSLGMRYKGLLD